MKQLMTSVMGHVIRKITSGCAMSIGVGSPVGVAGVSDGEGINEGA